MLSVLDIAFPDRYISAESFEALWCTPIYNRMKHRTVPRPEYGAHFAELIWRITTRAGERRASSDDANNLPQSTYDISQVATELVPEELQI